MRNLKDVMTQDGTVLIFHLTDGWIRRLTVDAKEIGLLGQGVLTPSREQYERVRDALPRTKPQVERAAALRWPGGEKELPPPWYSEVVADEPWAQGPLLAEVTIDPRDAIIAELKAKLAAATTSSTGVDAAITG